jgi:hypothetical protein
LTGAPVLKDVVAASAIPSAATPSSTFTGSGEPEFTAVTNAAHSAPMAGSTMEEPAALIVSGGRTHQDVRHVEVVDHHVPEKAARDLDVGNAGAALAEAVAAISG